MGRVETVRPLARLRESAPAIHVSVFNHILVVFCRGCQRRTWHLRNVLIPLDLSARLKRPGKIASRSSKSPSQSTISAPPKAAVADGKSKREDLHRRKNPFNEMLLQKSAKEAGNTSPSTPDEREDRHTRSSSIASIKSIQDAKTADRIAELERALAVAREEQKALREELEKARKHGTVYRDARDDYRKQLHGPYNRSSRSASPMTDSTQTEYEEDISPRRSWSQQREELIEQNYELRGKLADLQEQLVEQDTAFRTKLDQEMHKGEREWNELTGRLHQSEKESQERLQQLLDLKHNISTLTRMDSQVTDFELAEKVDQLFHRTREWVISNFRRTKPDFNNVPRETARALELISVHYNKIGLTNRLAFYQAMISSNLMHLFREPICIGLPETGPLAPIRQLATSMHDTGSEYREWRRTTIRALEKSPARQQLQQEKERLLHNISSQIQHQLFSVTSTNLTPQAQLSLLGILNAAADLQHVLLLQKAQYKVHFFRDQECGRVSFDESRMDSINDNDMDDDFIDRKFCFCVFPLLEKFGDEAGENVDVRNVLLKARVCCGVG
ncbi:uncharacterized protein BDR25DRAFT_307750 [Lindgomyces ingoldianus]|uniref:Uncharacterized protein n=1 Tax=Lindgomyces ingoldianus TaxID=673940 RepID=A0ACB6Q933_9PLEO|nr:uncharacterized protein BDR25DRAFT_307750 [Lindgomyces ingoldianus]KAF2463459.1 hypothetical protein BDR25DRAFT_307750 [Lindgomyces ingoldianus]